MAVKHAICINILIKMILGSFVLHIHGRSRCEEALVCRRGSDGTGVHEGHGSDLSALQLGSLPVGEVPCGVADGEGIVGRCVSRAKAGTAESCLHNGSRLHKVCHRTVLYKFHVDRRTCRVYTECKLVGADIFSADDISRGADIFKPATGASGDDALVHVEFSVHDLVLEGVVHHAVQADKGFLLYIVEHVL